MNDGRVLFTRWEYTDTPHYFTRAAVPHEPRRHGPDRRTTAATRYWPNSMFYARPIPGHPTKFVGIVSGHHGVPRMGELVIFDPALGRHEADGVVQRIPGYGKKVEPIIARRAGRRLLAASSCTRIPLSEKYFLVVVPARRRIAVGHLPGRRVRQHACRSATSRAYALLEPVPLRKTTRPPVIPDRVDTCAQGRGRLPGRRLPRRRARRACRAARSSSCGCSRSTTATTGMGGHTHVGIEGPWDVQRILGTVPVEADGSAAFRVPANTPIAVQPLDEDGKALQLMRSWFAAMPGESALVRRLPREHEHDRRRREPTIAAQADAAEDRRRGTARRAGSASSARCSRCSTSTASAATTTSRTSGQKLVDLRAGQRAEPSRRAYMALQPYVRRPGPESDYHMFRSRSSTTPTPAS